MHLLLALCLLPLSDRSALLAAEEASFAKAREIAEECSRSIVSVEVVGEEQGKPVAITRFSGFVFAADAGLVVACAAGLDRVLAGGGDGQGRRIENRRLEITFESKWRGTATLRAFDETTGICVIAVAGDYEKPPNVALEPVSSLSQGKPVLIVANPFGLHHSARCGFVIGPGIGEKECGCPGIILGLDAVRGEEGGLVCDLDRSFAGVVLPIATKDLPAKVPGGEGVRAELAGTLPQVEILPARAVRAVVKHLKEGTPVLRGWIGARFTASRRDGENRIAVTSVTAGSPAATSGLLVEDIILAANDKPVATIADLYDLALWVEYEGLGKEVKLTARRGAGEAFEIVVAVALKPKKNGTAAAAPAAGEQQP